MDSLSTRGQSFVAQKPTFFDVLSDLWDPKSNPNGILNIGLAENVKISPLRDTDTIADSISDFDAHRNEGIYQRQCKF